MSFLSDPTFHRDMASLTERRFRIAAKSPWNVDMLQHLHFTSGEASMPQAGRFVVPLTLFLKLLLR